MVLACYQFNATDQQGNIAPGASVEVIRESAGTLASLFSDRAGAVPISNPFTADANGFAQFFVTGGAYKLTVSKNGSSQVWRYVGIGTANESDAATLATGLVPQGQWTSGIAYAGATDMVFNRGSSYICTVSHTSAALTEPGVGANGATVWTLMSERGGDDPKWRFDSTITMADPGTGDIRFNSATLASITAVAISDLSTEAGNPSFVNWQLTWDDSTSAIRGYLTLRKVLAPEQYVMFAVTGLTDNAAWNQLAVTYIGSSGALFTNNDQVYVSFTRTGDIGLSQGLTWTFNATTTMADSGVGTFRLNNAALASTTKIAFDDTTNVSGNPDVSPFVISWGTGTSSIYGYLHLVQVSNPANFAVYQLTGVTDQVGYVEVDVTHVASAGTLSGSVVVSFTRTGDKGDQGVPGPAGGIGSLGVAKGSIPVADGSQYLELVAGANGTVLQADSTQAQGQIYRTVGAMLAKGSRAVTNLVSAATSDIGNQATDYINLTGGVGITSFGSAPNKIIKVRFAAATAITYNGTTLITPGLVSFTAAAGDEAVLASDSTGNNWKFIGYTMANSSPQKLIRGDAVNTVLSTAERTVARLNTYAGSLESGGLLGLLTNPYLEISQEHGNTLKSGIAAITYLADQWLTVENAATLVTSGQNVVNPFSGTANFKRLSASVKVIATTAQASYAAGEYVFAFEQKVEGNFLRHLGWGTADARAIDLVLILQASVAGTYTAALRNGAADRSYVTSFTLAANTPTVVLLTIPGDTSGTWATDSSVALNMDICCLSGTTFQASSLNAWGAGNFISHASATNWGATLNAFVQLAYCQAFPTGVLPFTAASQITGEALQMLLGLRRPWDVELARCMRYWEKSTRYATAVADGVAYTTDGFLAAGVGLTATGGYTPPIFYKVPKRAVPTLSFFRTTLGATAGMWQYFKTAWTDATAMSTLCSSEIMFAVQLTGTFTINTGIGVAGAWSSSSRM